MNIIIFTFEVRMTGGIKPKTKLSLSKSVITKHQKPQEIRLNTKSFVIF